MTELVRLPIPSFKLKKHIKGYQTISHRNFPTGEEEYLRFFRGEKFAVEIKFGGNINTKEALVEVSTDINGEWQDYPCQDQADGRFGITLTFNHCGVFHFKVKYSFNEGKTWYWDNVPHTTFFVDPIEMQNLKMYTLIPTVSGHFGDWMRLLYHIKDLGFNAVHLLPITELDISESPYSANDLFLPDYSYGIPGDQRDLLDQFEDFVRLAKDLELKLCFDIVLNHVGISSKMSIYSSDWIATDSSRSDGLKRAGCWDGNHWRCWEDLALIKYDHPNKIVRHELWHYMKKYLLFWSNYAAYTNGIIRLDNLHSTNKAFLKYVMKEVKKDYPYLVVFGELFTDQQTAINMALECQINLLLATPWIAPYAQDLRNFLSHLHNIYNKLHYLVPLTSHDSGSPRQEYGAASGLVPRYAAYAFFGTGFTGITQGSEFGVPSKIEFIGRQKKLEMSGESWGVFYRQEIKKIHQMLDEYSVLLMGKNLKFVDQNHGAVLAGVRFDMASKKGVLILANLDIYHSQSVELNLSDLPCCHLLNATLREKFQDNIPDLVLTTLYPTFELLPCGVKFLDIIMAS